MRDKLFYRQTMVPTALMGLLSLWVLGCSSTPTPEPDPTPVEEAPPAVVVEEQVEPQPVVEEPTPEPEVEVEEPDIEETIDPAVVLAGLTMEEKVGQMMMPFVLGDYAPEGSASHERIVEMVEEQKIGGVVMSVGSPSDVAVKLNDLQRHSDIPLLVGADLETGPGFRLNGAVHSPTNIFLGGATNFPSLMAIGATDDPDLAYEMGRVTAVEALAVGIHVPFAPVLDVNSNPDNPIINTRSFGGDPARVSELGVALVRGIEDHGAIATGKHFPGHGDTDVDSHLGLPLISASRVRMDTLELVPFQAAIDAGMSGIMTAHITVPALNGGTQDPSTLSGAVLTDLLKEEMQFEGILFTDAMDMGAIDRGFGRQEAAVRAVEAGADVILMPPSVAEAIEGIVAAVESGRIPEARIDEAVLKILHAKSRVGVLDKPEVDIDRLPEVVGVPEHIAIAQEAANRSITLLKNEGELLPLIGTRGARVLSVTYRRTNDVLASRIFDAGLRLTYPRLTTVTVTRDSRAEEYDAILSQASRSQLVVVAMYVTAVSYQGSLAVADPAVEFVQELASRGIPHVVVSFGNPYLLADFPEARAYMLAWSGSEVSQRAAYQALFGRFEVNGRTPTSLPPFFEIGDGIRLPAKDTRGR